MSESKSRLCRRCDLNESRVVLLLIFRPHVLQASLGGEEEDFGGEDDDLDFGDEGGDDLDFGGDDDGMDFDEDEETQGTKPAVDKKKAFQGKVQEM
jgi:hypothetical protein